MKKAMVLFGLFAVLPFATGQAEEIWIAISNYACTPSELPFNVFGPVSFTLNASASISGNLSQNVPANAPAGTYRYVGYVGT
jgi:hypothetical protein